MGGMGVEVASAYVTLMPSMKGFQNSLDKQLKGITSNSGARAGDTFGSGFRASAAKWAKRGAVAIGAAAATALGSALWKGWNRLTAIEDAEAKLDGLGHSAKTVETIMTSALDSVRGTAYGLGDAATIAAGAVAAGVKPGKELTGYLKTAADAATIAGVSINEMGPIFNRVQTQQRAYTMELNMLADRGIPIYQWLQEELGVSQEALRDMVSAGEVDSETYFRAIEKNIGGAALESGKTTRGTLANIGAAMSRLGATILGTVFPMLQPFFTQVITWIDWLTDGIAPMAEAFSEWFQGLSDGTGILGSLREGFEGLVKLFSGEGTAQLANWLGVDQGHIIIDFLQNLRDFVTETLPDAFTRLGDIIGGVFQILTGGPTGKLAAALGVDQGAWIVQVFQDIRDAAIGAFTWIRDEGLPALEGFGDWISDNRPMIEGIATAVLTFAGGLGALMGASKLASVAVGLVTTAVGLLRGAFTLLMAHPILLTIAALAGLFVYLWQTNEDFRVAVLAAWEQISGALTTAWEDHIKPALLALRDWIVDVVAPAIMSFWEDTVKPAFQRAGEFIMNVWETLIKPMLSRLKDFILESVVPAIIYLWQDVIKPTFKIIADTIIAWWNELVGPALGKFFSFIENDLGPIVLWLWDYIIRPAFEFIGAFIKNTWEEMILPALKGFSGFITDTVIPVTKKMWEKVGDYFGWMRDAIDTVWNNGIKPTFNTLKDAVGSIVDAFSTAVSGVKRAWEYLRMWVAKPIVAVLEFVNSGIIGGINKVLSWVGVDGIPTIPISQDLKNAASGWYLKDKSGGGVAPVVAKASGGILPGYSPGVDDYLFRGDKFNLALSGGEAIMRPEWTKAIGSDAIDAMNAAARTGGVNGVRDMLAAGGNERRTGGGSWGWLGNLGSGALDFFKSLINGPVEAITNLFMGPIDMLKDNPFYDFAVGAVKKIAGLAKDKFLSYLPWGSDGEDGGIGGKAGAGLPWQTLWGMIKMLVPSAIMTSNFRKNAITRSGFRSYHGLGRAVDFVAPNMTAAFKAIRPLLPWSELYYSPMGYAQMRNGRNYNTYGTPAYADHFDHIHAAFAKGGIFTGLFDNGGMLPPGLSLVANKTGKPEPVLTDTQWDAIKNGGGGGDTYNLFGIPMDATGEVAAAINYETRRTRRGKYARNR